MSQAYFKLLIVVTAFLLSSCGADPSGDVAYVKSRDDNTSGGVVRFEVRKEMRELAEREGFTLYSRISVHSVRANTPNCVDVRTAHVSRSPTNEEERLAENGWVAIKDRADVLYRIDGELVFVRLIGGEKEIRCQRPTPDRPIRVHVHFLGRPLPFGSSDEGMLGLDVFIPRHEASPENPV